MSIRKHLNELVNELEFIHSEEFSWGVEHGIPCFVTAMPQGGQVNFTPTANECLRKLAIVIFENRRPEQPRIELPDYINQARQAVANLFVAGDFDEYVRTGDRSVINKLKLETENLISKCVKEFTHYFPAWTLGMESENPFVLGPVSLISRENWIDTVDFPQKGKDTYLGETDANNNWKNLLKEALKSPNHQTEILGLASTVYHVVKDCPSLIKVTVTGFEKDYSRKLALIVSKTALDSLSLLLGQRSYFLQQALHEERLGPIHTHRLVETNGNLWLPGGGLSDRVGRLPKERREKFIKEIESFFPSIISILEGLLNPGKHSHPKLVMRWATALDWFGEACRESSDSVAIAKLGTSLDVLSNGGKFGGIADMVSNLLGMDRKTHIIKQDKPKTLNELIKQIYDDGRSKVLHGTYYDRLESLEAERKHAYQIARLTLISAVKCLCEYTGEDNDKAFRKMYPIESDLA
ncbi:HEPN domain-containing protein [Pseudoalteromonas obscura]|uniref:HEPN domain-containing protein n=1 Tax=Pseudoalteromonas obscura TaxID=3048491 RepID=A0ABT7EJM8_9GAMM|nr:HEPN domain-containing protein [Pseudoalteromonas sp. P94(2023)]MDK2595223.1 HEPN domain-containing protein [Pseudoalteromonas sp. P94(2023)]